MQSGFPSFSLPNCLVRLGDVFKWLRDKALLAALRQILKDVVKDIHEDQLECITLTKSGLGFIVELSDLQLNNAYFNDALLSVTDGRRDGSTAASSSAQRGLLTLASAHVDSVKTTFSLDAEEERRIDVNGVRLVFDVNPYATERSPSCGHLHHAGTVGSSGDGHGHSAAGNTPQHGGMEEIFSSLDNEGLLRCDGAVGGHGFQGGDSERGGGPATHTLDEAVRALTCRMEELAYSISGRISNVSVILRVPPQGEEIVPGQLPPPGTIKLLLSLEGGLEVDDATPGPNENKLRKVARFSGLRAAIFRYVESQTEGDGDADDGEAVDMSDIFLCSGHPTELLHRAEFIFEKTRNVSGVSRGSMEIHIAAKVIFLILSPTQLGFLVHVCRALTGTPGPSTPAAVGRQLNSNVYSSQWSSMFVTIRCELISSTFLFDEDRNGVKLAWGELVEHLQKNSDSKLLSSREHRIVLQRCLFHKGFYEVYVSGIRLLVRPMCANVSPSEGSVGHVFGGDLGRYMSVGIVNVEVYEQLPCINNDCAAGNGTRAEQSGGSGEHGRVVLTTKVSAASKCSRRFRVAIIACTTYPLTSDAAKKYKEDFPHRDNDAATFVLQRVAVSVWGIDLISNMSLNTLKRFGSYWERLQSTVNGAASDGVGGRTRREWESSCEEAKQEEGNVSEVPPTTAPPLLLTPEAEVPVSHGKPVMESYVVLRSFALEVESATIEVMFTTSAQPDPNYWGPLTRRLWNCVSEEGKAMNASPGTLPIGFGDDEGPYLPITLCFCLEDLKLFVDCSGNMKMSMGRMLLSLNDHKENTVSGVECLFDTEGEGHCVSIQHHVACCAPENVSRSSTVQIPFTEEYDKEEREGEDSSVIVVHAVVREVNGILHKCEFLLMTFFLSQVAETVDKLCIMLRKLHRRVKESRDTVSADMGGTCAEGCSNLEREGVSHLSTESDCQIARVSVRLLVGGVSVGFWAPRLSSAGVSIGEELWRCIPEDIRRVTTVELLYHKYQLGLSGVEVFSLHEASDDATNVTLHFEALCFRFEEILCYEWSESIDLMYRGARTSTSGRSETVRLLQGYDTRCDDAKGTQTHSSIPKVVGVSLRRLLNCADLTETFHAIVHLNRILMSHQPAWEGDHWLFVVFKYFSDPSSETANSAASPNTEEVEEHELDAVDTRSDDGVSIAVAVRVKVNLFDTMVEYRPFGIYSVTVGFCPYLGIDVTTSCLPTGPTVVKVFLGEAAASLFIHDDFSDGLLVDGYGAKHASFFSCGRRSTGAHFRSLGFVKVLDVRRSVKSVSKAGGDIKSISGGEREDKAALVVSVNPMAEKPVFVTVHNLCVDMFFAQDSLYHFRTAVTRFFSGLDVDFLSSPYLLVRRSGGYFSDITHVGAAEGKSVVDVHLLVRDYDVRLRHLLSSSVVTIPLKTLEGAQQVLEPIFVNDDALSLSDFDMLEDLTTANSVPVAWKTRGDEEVDLLKHCTFQNFLSVHRVCDGCLPSGHWNFPSGDRLHATNAVPWRTPPFSAVSMEVFARDCDFAVHLYGGEDFVRANVPQAYLRALHSFAADEVTTSRHEPSRREATGSTSSDVFRLTPVCGELYDGDFAGGRRRDQCVVAYARDICAQFDRFAPGKAHLTEFHLSVRDGEVIDRIEGSTVETILMATLPPSLRDRDSGIFSLKWTTVLPFTSLTHSEGVIEGKPEEEIRVRLQPITVALHSRTMSLLPRFLEVPEQEAEADVTRPGSRGDSFFFRKIEVHPVSVIVYAQFEGMKPLEALQGNMTELRNYLMPTIDRVCVQVPRMVIVSCPAEDVLELFCQHLGKEIGKFRGLFLLCCGVQPLRLASNVASAGTEVLFAPFNEHRRNKRFFAAVCCALRSFLITVATESLHGAAGVSHSLHRATSSSISYLVPASGVRPMPRGSQPANMTEGVQNGLMEIAHGVSTAYDILVHCLGPQGNSVCLPVALPAVLDGILRGMGEVFRGARNTIAPEIYEREKRIFKGGQNDSRR